MLTSIFQFIILLTSFFIIFTSNSFILVFSLIFLFFCIFFFFLSLEINFIALSFLIIYIGAVAILFIFVIMFLGQTVTIKKSNFFFNNFNNLLSLVFILVLFLKSFFLIFKELKFYNSFILFSPIWQKKNFFYFINLNKEKDFNFILDEYFLPLYVKPDLPSNKNELCAYFEKILDIPSNTLFSIWPRNFELKNFDVFYSIVNDHVVNYSFKTFLYPDIYCNKFRLGEFKNIFDLLNLQVLNFSNQEISNGFNIFYEYENFCINSFCEFLNEEIQFNLNNILSKDLLFIISNLKKNNLFDINSIGFNLYENFCILFLISGLLLLISMLTVVSLIVPPKK